MKRLGSIFFLLILFLPPLLKASVKIYYELNKEYIAANLCVNKDRPITMCYGRCFVDAKIQLIDQSPAQSGTVSQLKLEVSDFLLFDFGFNATVPQYPVSFHPQQAPSLMEGCALRVFRPPLA